jgi:NAD(P)H-hydrate epimerase
MRLADDYAMQTLGIPAPILMENAARAAFDISRCLLKKFMAHHRRKRPQILVLCGSGNNGGDGFVLARHWSHEADVHVIWCGAEEKMSEETRGNLTLLKTHTIPTTHCNTAEILNSEAIQHLFREADCIVDALIGNGGNEHLRGIVPEILRTVRKTHHSGRLAIAIDIPSGLNAETGKAHTDCFRADATVSMATLKTGLLLNDAPDFTGECFTVPIGIPLAFLEKQATVRVIERSDIPTFFLPRPRRSTKYDFGAVAVIGGTAAMPGAPALAANACIGAGAGLVRLYAPCIHPSLKPEVMAQTLPSDESGIITRSALPFLEEAIEKHSVIIIGPGLGNSPYTLDFIREMIRHIPPEKPVVIDADGLRAVRTVDDTGKDSFVPLHTNTVLTPHRGEFAHLTGCDYGTIPETAQTLAPEWAAKIGCTILLKNVPTIITDGRQSFWNTSGNAGMATAGSGDVLAGMIGAFLAQRLAHGWEFLETVALAAYCHGAAGDAAAALSGQQSVTASSIIACFGEVLAQKEM